MALTLLAPAIDFPIDFNEVKTHCGVEDDTRDDLLESLLTAAVDHVEAMTGRALMAQDWRLTLDRFADAISIEKSPVLAVTSIGYRDAAGVVQELDPSAYVLDLVSDPPQIARADGVPWPGVTIAPGAVVIEFTAGYSSIDAVPARTKLAVKQMVAQWFENRASGSVSDATHDLLDRRVML